MAELILLMGPTGAGKSVQGDRWAEAHDGVHLSSGSLLRRDPEVAAVIASGKLFPAQEVERIVGEAIEHVPEDKPIMLDGLPRTMSNVHWLEQTLPRLGRDLKRVVLIDLDLETSLERLSLRDRDDDSRDAIEEKYREYERNTHEVIDYYDQRGLLVRIDGRRTIDEVTSELEAALA